MDFTGSKPWMVVSEGVNQWLRAKRRNLCCRGSSFNDLMLESEGSARCTLGRFFHGGLFGIEIR